MCRLSLSRLEGDGSNNIDTVQDQQYLCLYGHGFNLELIVLTHLFFSIIKSEKNWLTSCVWQRLFSGFLKSELKLGNRKK